ncbi:unnamed protein product, partial [marine sediment metagenome]
MADYIELLIKTSEIFEGKFNPVLSVYDEADDRQSRCRSGYLVTHKPVGYQWGGKELDPKYFMRIVIPELQFDP